MAAAFRWKTTRNIPAARRSKSSTPCSMPAASSTPRPTRPPVACMASAFRWSTPSRDDMVVEVAREQQLYRLQFSRGKPIGEIEKLGRVNNRRGTTTRFHPDPQIFGDKAEVLGTAPVQDDARQGLSLRRRRAALELRRVAGHRRVPCPRRLPLSRRPARFHDRPHRGRDAHRRRHLLGQSRQARHPWRHRMGDCLDAGRWRRLLLLQYRAHPRWRHA